MESAPVRMTVRWNLAPGEARSIAATLQTQMVETRASPGCLGCSLSTDADARMVVYYMEEWRSEEDLQRQIRSRRFATLAELMEHCTAPPVVEFKLRGGTRGLEYAEQVIEARNGTDVQ